MEPFQNKQNVRRYILLAAVLLIFVWIFLVRHETAVRQLNPSDIDAGSLEDGYAYYIDSLSTASERIAITGWFLRSGEDIRNVSLKIVLKNTETGQCYILPTTMELREDVTAHYADGHDYDNCGFQVNIPYDRGIDPDTYDYELFAWYTLKDDSRLISLETTLKTWEDLNGQA